MKGFATGLIAALALLVALAVLGMVYARSSYSERDLNTLSALTVSRRFADGFPFMKKAFEDAVIDSAFANGCTSADFCTELNAKLGGYNAKALEFLVAREAVLFNKLDGFTLSCGQLPAAAGFNSSFGVNATGSYVVWAGNSSFALAKKSSAFSWNWTVDIRNSSSLDVVVTEAGVLLRSISVSCP